MEALLRAREAGGGGRYDKNAAGDRRIATGLMVFSPSEECAQVQRALDNCKTSLGLLPRQCYRPGQSACDAEEFALKKCQAFAVDPRDARVLYSESADRTQRVNANARLQKKLKPFNKPCMP